MDMILFEVLLKNIDLIPQQQILQQHYLYYRSCHCTIWSCGIKWIFFKKHFKKDHVHMRLWSRFYGRPLMWFYWRMLKIFCYCFQLNTAMCILPLYIYVLTLLKTKRKLCWVEITYNQYNLFPYTLYFMNTRQIYMWEYRGVVVGGSHSWLVIRKGWWFESHPPDFIGAPQLCP